MNQDSEVSGFLQKGDFINLREIGSDLVFQGGGVDNNRDGKGVVELLEPVVNGNPAAGRHHDVQQNNVWLGLPGHHRSLHGIQCAKYPKPLFFKGHFQDRVHIGVIINNQKFFLFTHNERL